MRFLESSLTHQPNKQCQRYHINFTNWSVLELELLLLSFINQQRQSMKCSGDANDEVVLFVLGRQRERRVPAACLWNLLPRSQTAQGMAEIPGHFFFSNYTFLYLNRRLKAKIFERTQFSRRLHNCE